MGQTIEETQSDTATGFQTLLGRCRSRVARACDEIRQRAVLRAEFAHLRDTGQLDRVLSDIGVDHSQISTLIKNHPGSARRMAAMLRHLGIEPRPEAVNSVDMRAIQRTCLLCAASNKCDRWLHSDDLEDPSGFCPNARAFRELVGQGRATYRQDA